ncbi:peptidase [Fulvivirga sp. RKSG066]|uniref:peptidase n=1 Tax=Fulvivirga aurantia TaxID=2529383 RepID=UPI0012BB79F6|nr:peptidase [Fulvivirga aurantia]MTI20971.1 peptidase [Fulvivirga aurantia]
MDNLKNMSEELLNKPDGINIVQTEISSLNKDLYTLSDIRAIEDNNRSNFTKGGNLSAYILIVDGDYSVNNNSEHKTLGLAYNNTSIVLFQKSIEKNSGKVGQPSNRLLSSTVVNHEFGHLLGLTNNGTEIQSNHHHAEKGAHCTSTNCLMYYKAVTDFSMSDMIGLSSPKKLDAQCRADLQANGGK